MAKKTYNPFDFCENALNNINFVTFKRFRQIHRYFYQSPRVKFVPKKVWKKSSSKSNPDGGKWEFLMRKNQPNTPQVTPDLTLSVKPIEEQFNFLSKRFCLPDVQVGIAIDEILKQDKSRFNPLRLYMPGKKAQYRFKLYFVNDNRTNFLYKAKIQYPGQFQCPQDRTVQGLTLNLLSDFFKSGVACTCDRYYSSVPLLTILHRKKISYLGTCNINRLDRYMDEAIGKGKLKKLAKNTSKNFVREVVVFSSPILHSQTQNIWVHLYNDNAGKQGCLFVTNDRLMLLNDRFSTKNVPIVEANHSQILEGQTRPQICHSYKRTMGSVDVFDQYLHKYSVARKFGSKNKDHLWLRKLTLTYRDMEFINCLCIHEHHMKADGKTPLSTDEFFIDYHTVF